MKRLQKFRKILEARADLQLARRQLGGAGPKDAASIAAAKRAVRQKRFQDQPVTSPEYRGFDPKPRRSADQLEKDRQAQHSYMRGEKTRKRNLFDLEDRFTRPYPSRINPTDMSRSAQRKRKDVMLSRSSQSRGPEDLAAAGRGGPIRRSLGRAFRKAADRLRKEKEGFKQGFADAFHSYGSKYGVKNLGDSPERAAKKAVKGKALIMQRRKQRAAMKDKEAQRKASKLAVAQQTFKDKAQARQEKVRKENEERAKARRDRIMKKRADRKRQRDLSIVGLGSPAMPDSTEIVRKSREALAERVLECWKTHKKVGKKMKGGRLVNDCVPKNEAEDPRMKTTRASIQQAGGDPDTYSEEKSKKDPKPVSKKKNPSRRAAVGRSGGKYRRERIQPAKGAEGPSAPTRQVPVKKDVKGGKENFKKGTSEKPMSKKDINRMGVRGQEKKIAAKKKAMGKATRAANIQLMKDLGVLRFDKQGKRIRK